ncbi:hypothetical protein CsSME_00046971 [Camellia sinensis var. sinensis]
MPPPYPRLPHPSIFISLISSQITSPLHPSLSLSLSPCSSSSRNCSPSTTDSVSSPSLYSVPSSCASTAQISEVTISEVAISSLRFSDYLKITKSTIFFLKGLRRYQKTEFLQSITVNFQVKFFQARAYASIYI